MSSSTIEEHRYNDLHRKNQENKQFQVDVAEHGDSFRRLNLKGTEERSVNGPPRTIKEFYSVFQQMLDTADTQDGTNYGLKVTEQHPTDPDFGTEIPIITVSLKSRNVFAREKKARPIRIENDPDYPGDKIQIFQRRNINRIKLDIWTRTNKDGNVLVEWIEDKFFEYYWLFEWLGFNHVTFEGREEDDTQTIKNQLVHKRTLRFDVVTSKITKKRFAQIKKIKLELSVDKPDSNDLVDRS